MTPDRHPQRKIERYEQYYSLQDGKHYELTWKTAVRVLRTSGSKGFEMQFLELLPDSVGINERNAPASSRRKISLTRFNEEHPREQIDLRSNCHGFAFGDGKFFINSAQVPYLLADEFEQVPADEALATGAFDIVCLKEPLAGEWIHSARFGHGRYLHKQGIHPYKTHSSIRDLMSTPDFCDSIPYYFKRIAEPTYQGSENLVALSGSSV